MVCPSDQTQAPRLSRKYLSLSRKQSKINLSEVFLHEHNHPRFLSYAFYGSLPLPSKGHVFFKLTDWTHLVLPDVHCYRPPTGAWVTYQALNPWRKLTPLSQQPWTAKFIRQGGVKCPPLLEFWQFDMCQSCAFGQSLSSCVQRPCHVQKTLHRSPSYL